MSFVPPLTREDRRSLALHERIAERLRAAPAETLAAAVVGEREVIVIGSQAIHAWIEDDLPEAAMRSVEADIALRRDQLPRVAAASFGWRSSTVR